MTGATLGLAGAGTVAGADHDGTVSTRGHFEIGPWNFVYLAWGHDRTDYEVTDPVPGFGEAASPGEVVVFAHGWLVDEWSADVNFAYLDGTLAANGYAHPVVGYEWDADEALAVDDWYPSKEVARRNGTKLAAFLRDYRDRNRETAIRLSAHSLGAQVALSAVARLDEWGRTDVVDGLALLGAAVEDGAVSTADEFGDHLASAVGAVDNFHSRNDDTLATGFTGAEFDAALGNVGAQGPTPDNYEDHAVPGVTNHLAYFLEDEGCLDLVAAEWRGDGDDSEGDGGDGDGNDGDGGDGDGAVTETHTETGDLAGADDGAVYTYRTRTGAPERVAVSLTGEGEDFDLYLTLDGRTPTTDDYDRRSWSYDSSEVITVTGEALSADATLGVLVASYDGSGSYTLTVEETPASG